MKRITYVFAVGIACSGLILAVMHRYSIQHRVGYGAIDYTNGDIPSGFRFIGKEAIADEFLLRGDDEDIRRNGDVYQRDFSCKKLGRKADIIEYYNHTAGYGVVGGWSYRYAAVCGNRYLIIQGADHGPSVYGPFFIDALLQRR